MSANKALFAITLTIAGLTGWLAAGTSGTASNTVLTLRTLTVHASWMGCPPAGTGAGLVQMEQPGVAGPRRANDGHAQDSNPPKNGTPIDCWRGGSLARIRRPNERI